MDELDIRLLALTNREEAIAAAKLLGLWGLVREFSKRPVNVFAAVARARLTVADAGKHAKVPASTAAAAARGKIAGGLTGRERQALLAYLKERLAALQEAIELCERRSKL